MLPIAGIKKAIAKAVVHVKYAPTLLKTWGLAREIEIILAKHGGWMSTTEIHSAILQRRMHSALRKGWSGSLRELAIRCSLDAWHLKGTLLGMEERWGSIFSREYSSPEDEQSVPEPFRQQWSLTTSGRKKLS